MIVDGYGAQSYPRRWFQLLESLGAEIVIFNPLPWMKGLFGSVFRLNQRLHKKMWIIDRKKAYLGSLNIDTRHLSENLSGEGWRDTGVVVTGGRIGLLVASFNWDWNKANGKTNFDNDHMFFQDQIRLNHSPILNANWIDSAFLIIFFNRFAEALVPFAGPAFTTLSATAACL